MTGSNLYVPRSRRGRAITTDLAFAGGRGIHARRRELCMEYRKVHCLRRPCKVKTGPLVASQGCIVRRGTSSTACLNFWVLNCPLHRRKSSLATTLPGQQHAPPKMSPGLGLASFLPAATVPREFRALRWESLFSPHGNLDRKSTRLNSSHSGESRMPSSA